ncbi:cytochrome P450 CYP94D108 [Salvia miltiorrhiza]|uniref:cytochrome P450 CYP94D108 n=1 Tax=Salvia miltiorrhiza TaxID=226208 RepID=UPI0025AD8DD5|nr:cytochrome P450 CYP94D108 [Salvia miltiorrhiza]
MAILYLLTILLLSLSLCSLFLRRKSNKTAPHGYKLYPVVGTLPDFILNRHRFYDWNTETLARCPTNTSVFRRPGKVHGVITANPQIVEHMLKTNFDNYPKGARFISLLQDFLGAGIFNADAELWIMQRKTASYEFNTKSLRNFAMDNVAREIHNRLIPMLKTAAENNRTLDLQDVLERFAFDNVCKLAFNADPACLGGDATAGGEFMRAFETAANLSSGRFLYAVPRSYLIKKILNLGSEKKLREAIATVHEFADQIIRSRIEKITENKILEEDLLSRFIGKSENISAEFLRDIVISFILAGRDTTSSALSWLFWLLSSRRDIEVEILKELETIRRQSGKSIGDGYSYDELRRMHYLQAAISEAMRLYPPVPIDTRNCKNDDVLPDGTLIGKDWFISYSAYAMGRMESIWGKDCLEFRPQRWMENGVCKQESQFKYPVFHGGPRMCLGKDLAYIQMKAIAASVLERFEMEVLLEKGSCPQYLLSLTLRIKGGLHVRVKDRV